MIRDTVLTYALVALLAVMIVSVVGGTLLGYPVLLSFVESESMEPALDKNDGFLAIPAPVAGSVGSGDVVVFQAEQINGGDVTTHRIVEERPNGYVTKGDANPFTDQSNGEPLVTDGQIKAVVLAYDGSVVAIPSLGAAVGAVSAGLNSAERTVSSTLGLGRLGDQQRSLILFGIGIAAFALTMIGEGDRRGRSKERSRSRASVFDARLILLGSILFLCVGATAGMVGPAGTETINVLSSESGAEDPTIIPVGGTDSYESPRHNGGLIPTVSYFEPKSEGVSIEPSRLRLDRGETVNTTVTLHVPDETGRYLRSMTEHRYFVLVPPSVIDRLYGLHPWLPYLLLNALIAAPFLVVWAVFRNPSTLRLRRRSKGANARRKRQTDND